MAAKKNCIIRILFVCTGNTCRSAMAEALFNRYAAEAEGMTGCRAAAAKAVHYSGDSGDKYSSSGSDGSDGKSGNNGKDIRGCTASSAGIYAIDGMPASYYARKVLSEHYGLDLDCHKSRRVTRAMMEEAGLVLAMTNGHLEYLRREYPETADRIHLLSGYVDNVNVLSGADAGFAVNDGAADIDDPFGENEEAYLERAREIDTAVSRLAAHLCGTACM